MTSTVGYVALLAWFLVSHALSTRLRPTLAIPIIVIGGTLVLPERVAVDLPLIPAFTKHTIPMLCAVIACARMPRNPLRSFRPGLFVVVLLVLVLAGPVGTYLTNQDSGMAGGHFIAPLSWQESLSAPLEMLIVTAVPFALGYTVCWSTHGLRDLLRVLGWSLVAYAPFVLIELRMSPQMNVWVYGFAQHVFAQTMRGDGYRPLVFLAHGLALALLEAASSVALAVLARADALRVRRTTSMAAVGMGVLLIACKSMGAAMCLAAAAVALTLLKPANQIRAALVVGLFTLGYPVLRGADMVPTAAIVEWVEHRSPERAQSLAFRFDNEALLLARARLRPVFGWGRFGRGRVYDADGNDAATTDGEWIIVYSTFGAVGYYGMFGLLVLPFVSAARAARGKALRGRRLKLIAGLSLIEAAFALDLVPNALFHRLPLLLAGALYGASRRGRGDPGDDPS